MHYYKKEAAASLDVHSVPSPAPFEPAPVSSAVRRATTLLALGAGFGLAAALPLESLAQSTPYTTPIAVPGTFEAENFDKGGQNVAYIDRVAGNAGGQYRTAEDVDIIASGDSAGGGYVVNNFETGEWLTYTISVPTTGDYDIELRASSAFTILFDTRTLSTRSLPDASKSTSNAVQRAAQSGRHCSFTFPPVTGTSVSVPSSSGKVMVPFSTSRPTVGACRTRPLLGLIGRKGE